MDPDFPQDFVEPPVPSVATVPIPPDLVESKEQFVERALADYESPLVGYAYGFVHDVERARDIVQDTFIRLCQQDVAKVKDSLKTWLFTVCRNRALDVLRKESRVTALDEAEYQSLPSNTLPPDRSLDQAERLDQTMRFLSRLPENQQTVILMKFRDGHSYQEICEMTGLSSGNVGFLIHTGLKRLRELLPTDLLSPP